MAMTCGFNHHLIDVVRHGDQDGGHTAFRPCEIQLNFGLELDNNNKTNALKINNNILTFSLTLLMIILFLEPTCRGIVIVLKIIRNDF